MIGLSLLPKAEPLFITPTQPGAPPSQKSAQIPTSNSLFQNPAHKAPLVFNRTLSVVQGFFQALLPILLVHLRPQFGCSTNCLHNPLPSALSFTSHFCRWVHPPG